MKRAADLAGVDRSTPYTRQWKDDVEFKEALAKAREMAIDALEAEVIRRAFEGVEEPVGWYKGQAGGYVRRYSDTLLIFRLKAERPEKYGDKLQLAAGLANLDVSKLPDEALQRIVSGEPALAVLASIAARLPPGLIPEGEAELIEGSEERKNGG